MQERTLEVGSLFGYEEPHSKPDMMGVCAEWSMYPKSVVRFIARLMVGPRESYLHFISITPCVVGNRRIEVECLSLDAIVSEVVHEINRWKSD